MGDRVGRVHMERQELDKLGLRKMKGLRKGRHDNGDQEAAGGDEGEDEGNDESDE